MLCTVHLLSQRPLWNDEQCVLYSIEQYTPHQMFTIPLLSIQVFPRVYLFIIQQISRPFDYHLVVLRLPAFACMMTAFFVWLKVARYALKDTLSYVTFVASWVASGLLLYYSAELKQYSMDILTGGLFLLFLYNQHVFEQRDTPPRWYLPVVVLLPVLGLFSYTAFFFAFLPLYNFFLASRKNKAAMRYASMYGCSLLAVITVSYFFDMRLRPVEILLTSGFKNHFISFESVGAFFTTLGEGINNFFSRWFVERPRFLKGIVRCFTGFGFLYMFYGFFKNIKKERWTLRSLDTIAFVLFMESLILGALHKYPFTIPRTSLFVCPVVLYLTVRGIVSARLVNKYLAYVMHSLYLIFLAFLIIAYSRAVFIGKLGFMPAVWP